MGEVHIYWLTLTLLPQPCTWGVGMAIPASMVDHLKDDLIGHHMSVFTPFPKLLLDKVTKAPFSDSFERLYLPFG